jgi:hypothetical protein
MLIGISSPYRKSGLLYDKYRRHFGQDGDVLVIKAPTTALNPTIDASIIARALEDDPEAARAEWLAEFRSDITAFVDRATVEALVVPGRRELPRVPLVLYFGFFDASGGSGGDSFASAVGHFDRATGCAVLDAVRERRPPFSPEATVEEHANFFKSYGITSVRADRWGGEFPAEQFRKHGVNVEVSERTKSEIYQEALSHLNSGRVQLLDHQRLVAQICGLERRTARGGKDSIDHSAGGRDDVANAALGCLVSVTNDSAGVGAVLAANPGLFQEIMAASGAMRARGVDVSIGPNARSAAVLAQLSGAKPGQHTVPRSWVPAWMHEVAGAESPEVTLPQTDSDE